MCGTVTTLLGVEALRPYGQGAAAPHTIVSHASRHVVRGI